MAKILPMKPLRCVGTTIGGPPHVETFWSGAAIKAGAIVQLSSGKLAELAAINAGTDDKLDVDTVTAFTAPLVGVTLNATTAANQIQKVAVFNYTNIFEGNFAGSSTAGAAASIVSGHVALALTHIGTKISFLLPATDTNHAFVDDTGSSFNYQISSTSNDRVIVLTTNAAGATPFFGRITKVDYGTYPTAVGGGPGIEPNPIVAKGTIGDKQARVQFQVINATAGYFLFGSGAA